MAIVAGLNMSSVSRLHFTMTVLSDMQVKQMDELMTLMGPNNRYKTYKDRLVESQLPTIPYLLVKFLLLNISIILILIFFLIVDYF